MLRSPNGRVYTICRKLSSRVPSRAVPFGGCIRDSLVPGLPSLLRCSVAAYGWFATYLLPEVFLL